MSSETSNRGERHRRILALIGRNRIDSQEQLLELLVIEGVETTQSTVSRDLRELGVVKGPDGYHQATGDAGGRGALERLAHELQGRLRDADSGGSMLVLRPVRAHDAPAIAARIDGMGLHHVVAAIACGNLVLVVARSQAYAVELASTLRRGAGAAPSAARSRLRRLFGGRRGPSESD